MQNVLILGLVIIC